MNEKNKLVIVIGIIIITILLIITVSVNSKGKDALAAFEQALLSTENTVVYIGRTSCSYCELYEPNLIEMSQRYSFPVTYINTDEVSNSTMEKILSQIDMSMQTLGTPYTVIVKNGEIIDEQKGFTDYDYTFDFLQKNGIISETAELLLNYLDYEGFEEIISSKTEQFLVVGHFQSIDVINYKLFLTSLAAAYPNLTINYLNYLTLTQEEMEKTLEFEYFQNEDAEIPAVLIVKDNELIDSTNKFTESDTIEFLEDNNMIGQESESIYEKFTSAFNASTKKVVYIGRTGCSYCTLYEPNLEEMSDRYDFEYLYINTTELTSEYIYKIAEDLNLDSISTPYTAILQNGKIVDEQKGFTDYDVTFEFFQDNGIIKSSEKLMLNYIDYDEYTKLLENEDKHIVIIGQSTCRFCIESKLILNELVEENENLLINYLNISYLTESEGAKLETTLSYFKDNWSVPALIVIENGKDIYSAAGLKTKEVYEEIFEEKGFL